jgi:hypothetical protein
VREEADDLVSFTAMGIEQDDVALGYAPQVSVYRLCGVKEATGCARAAESARGLSCDVARFPHPARMHPSLARHDPLDSQRERIVKSVSERHDRLSFVTKSFTSKEDGITG